VIKTLLVGAAALVLPFSANAADFPIKAPAFAPAPYNWTGFYVGINAGYGLGSTVIEDKNCNFSCSSQTLNPSGFTAGGALGFNYQIGSAVLGIEGDWNWINASKTYTDSGWPSQHNAKIDSFGTIRARAGLALDNTLAYVTAGAAFVDQQVSVFDPTGIIQGGFSFSKTKTGLAVGAGTEFALSGPWTAKLEYLYIAIPTVAHIPDDFWTSPVEFYNVKTDMQVIRVGLNYRF
jgi:outer membrane immunogenic protein